VAARLPRPAPVPYCRMADREEQFVKDTEQGGGTARDGEMAVRDVETAGAVWKASTGRGASGRTTRSTAT
jgi:hypothetical protein